MISVPEQSPGKALARARVKLRQVLIDLLPSSLVPTRSVQAAKASPAHCSHRICWRQWEALERGDSSEGNV